MAIAEKLASNTIYLFLDRTIITLFSFIFWLFLAKTVSVESYGIVSVSINLISIVSIFTIFGVSTCLSKLIPEFLTKKKINMVNSYIWSSFKLVSFITLVVSSILLLFSQPISKLLKLPHDAFLLVIVSIISITMYGFFNSVNYGFQKMKKYFISDAIGHLFKLIITVLLVLLGLKYLGPLIGIFICYVVISIILFDSSYIKNKNPISYKKLLYYSFPALIISVSNAIMAYGHYIILVILKNMNITGIFALAFTVSNIIIIFPSVFTFALFPIMSSLSVKKRVENIKGYLLGLILRYSLFIIVPLSLCLILFSTHVVLLFSRPDYISAANYFPLLIPASVISSLANIINWMFYAIGKPRICRNITVATTAIFLIISIPLTFYFSAIGMATAYLFSSFFAFIISFLLVKRYIKVHFFANDILKIFISSILISLLLYFLKSVIHNIFTLVIILIPVSVIYLLILLLLKFYRIEDIRLLKLLFWKIPFIKNIIGLFYGLTK